MPRSKANGRTAASNRVAVQDIKSSLSFGGTGYAVNLTAAKGFGMGAAYSVEFWVKALPQVASNTLYSNGDTSAAIPIFRIMVGNSGTLAVQLRNLENTVLINSLSTAKSYLNGQWRHCVWVDNAGVCTLYVDGVADTTNFNYTPSGTFNNLAIAISCLYRTGTAAIAISTMRGLRTYQRALTQAEVIASYRGSRPVNPSLEWLCNEGAGYTAYDSSGNGNHGTITAGTYTADVPTKKRDVVGGNMVYNGDFEYAPPFIAATTGSQVWVDGTASGSTTNNLFGWGVYKPSGSGEVKFDPTVSHSGTNSIKVSTTAIASRIAARSIFNDLNVLAKLNAIAVRPSTSYTVSAWIKTSVISGTASSGTRVRVVALDGNGNFVAIATSTPSITATTDWTPYSQTFTTGATIRYVYILLDANGSDGAANLIMDAWFDDITLAPTVNTTRTAV